MKALVPILLLLATSTATAQITIVDNPQNVWTGTNSHKLIMSEAVSVSSNADVFVLDVQTYANTNWSGVNLYLGSTLLTQAAGYCPSTGTKLDTAIYYALTPPTGNLTLRGTFGSATAGIANYYTLANVDTTKAVTSGTATAGTNPACSLTLSNTTGSFAAIDQVTLEAAGPSPDAGSYSATSGVAGMITSTGNGNIFGSDGYAQGLAGTSNTLTASVDAGTTANHAMCAAVFTSLPVSGPPTWSGSSGNWSTAGNWNTGVVPNAAGAMAVFSQTGAVTNTITLDDSPSLANLTLGNSGLVTTSYDLTGGTMNLSNAGSGALLTVSGTQEIDSQIAGSETLTMQGSGELILSNSGNDWTGGTVVESGTLIITTAGALPAGSSLTVGAGGTMIFDSSASAGPAVIMADNRVNAVPEPSTLLLVAVAAAVIFTWRRSMRTFVLTVVCLLVALPALAGEGGTGLMSPEPGTLTLGLAGAAGLGAYAIWRAKSRFNKIDQDNEEASDGDD